jgi:hypothetical protein
MATERRAMQLLKEKQDREKTKRFNEFKRQQQGVFEKSMDEAKEHRRQKYQSIQEQRREIAEE